MPGAFTVLIMAAGRGTRMRSELPKVLHPVCGKPMVEWVIDAAREAGAGEVICITRPGDGVAEGLPGSVTVAEQRTGEGTGAAILAARETGPADGTVLVLSGDHPLLEGELIGQLVATHERESAMATLLTTDQLDPAGYGRVMRAPDGSVERIVETKHTEDLSAEELGTREVNLGTYAFDASELWSALEGVGEQRDEIYLTGVFPIMREREGRLVCHQTHDVSGAMGINTRADLMEVDRLATRRILAAHARAGVTFLGPDSTRVEAGVTVGADTTVWPGVTLRGATSIGAGCEIGPQTTITDSTLGDGVKAVHSFLIEASAEAGASLGPFAYLRPGAEIGTGAKIGTFVEIKNSRVGSGAKVPHLSYIGDADVGTDANVGAGNITANYDGRDKHHTRIGARAKTGVHTSLVAPVSVGEGAYTGAGSVIAEDVPDGALGISRPDQTNVEGYAQRKEKPPG